MLFLYLQLLTHLDGVALQVVPLLEVVDGATIFPCDGAERLSFLHCVGLSRLRFCCLVIVFGTALRGFVHLSHR